MMNKIDWTKNTAKIGIYCLCIFCFAPNNASALVGIEVMTQSSNWTLDQVSAQKKTTQSGTYLYIPLGSMAYLEGAQEQLSITYAGSLPSLQQGDQSAALNLLLGPLMFSGGVHKIKSTNSNVDKGSLTAYSASIPDILHLSLGYSNYKTKFPNFTPTNLLNQPGLIVNQDSLEVGINLFDGRFELRNQQEKINLSAPIDGVTKEYKSNQIIASIWLQPFFLTYATWSGKRLFYASNKGLYLNSLDQVYTGGDRSTITWMAAAWIDIALIQTHERFIEKGFVNPLKAKIDTVNLTLRF